MLVVHPRRSTRAGVVAVVAAGLFAAGLVAPTPARAETAPTEVTAAAITAGGSALVQQRPTAIAPGLTMTSFQRLQPGGWVTGHVMDADLTTESLSLDVVDGGTVSASNATVETFARDAQAVAAVNGDYFDINASEAPVGTNISPTGGVRTAAATARESFTLTDGKAAVQALMSSATLTHDGDSLDVASVNSPGFRPDTIALFTGAWGTHPVGRLLPAAESVRVVVVRDGRVVSTTTDRTLIDSTTPVPAGASVLVARGTAMAQLTALATGDAVELTVEASADVDLAVGGSQRLVTDGRATTVDEVTAARTAIGVSRDGSAIKVITIDGRGADAHGMTIQELAAFMVDLGVWNAVNLDGGGSTTLVARPAGTDDLQLINRPSDGNQRVDTNALVFRSTAADATDTTAGVRLRPQRERAAGLPESAAYTTLPGLSRTVVGTALAPDLDATPATAPRLTTDGPAVKLGATTRTGPYDRTVVTGVRPGSATLTYRSGEETDTMPITVFGPLQRLEASQRVVALADADATAALTVTAVDADGHRVPVETRDLTVRAGAGVTVTPAPGDPSGRGDALADRFVIGATGATRSGTVTLAAQGQSITVAVTVGYDEVAVTDFADPSAFTAGTARATGTLGAGTGPEGGPALALDFDFTQSTGTRGMYALPTAPIRLPGQPQSVSMWVKGNGKGEWPRLQVTKGDGTSTNLDGEHLTFTGWRKLTFAVPAGTPYPLTLTAIRLLEIRADVSYTDRVEIADLRAQVPVAVDVPPTPRVIDPVILTQGDVDDRPLRIAVMSDTQFVARDPDSELVRAGRETLREIVAARPELLIIAGDFVDEASPADIALAKRVLDEEVGDAVPYVYVPGNHEIMGGSIENFRAVFGDTSTVRTIRGTKIITLDSSTGTLHPGSSTAQLRLLETELASAATDPSVTGVVVVDHHPVDDPQPDQASQLTDRVEADAVARTLAAFGRTSGKHVAQVNGHVGVFHGSARDGVSRVINGNSGKSPSGTPAAGGFTGWSMVGIDPQAGSRTGWFAVQTRARVDELTLTAPATLPRSGRGTASATVLQDGTRQVPVAWPLTATWGGAGVGILGGRPTPRDVVLVDPATGALRAVRPGTATLTVTVNGVSASRTVTVR